MKKLLLSAIICSILLWSCEKHPGNVGTGFKPLNDSVALAMIYHYLDSNVTRVDSTIIRQTTLTRGNLLWSLADKDTRAIRLSLAAYLNNDPDSSRRNTITMLLAIIHVDKDKKITYKWYDMRDPVKPLRADESDPLCPPPNNCDPQGPIEGFQGS